MCVYYPTDLTKAVFRKNQHMPVRSFHQDKPSEAFRSQQ